MEQLLLVCYYHKCFFGVTYDVRLNEMYVRASSALFIAAWIIQNESH